MPSVQQPVGSVGSYLPITALENCLELWILAPPHTRLHTISGAQGALPSHLGLEDHGLRIETPAEGSASPSQFTTNKMHSLKGLTATGSIQNPGEPGGQVLRLPTGE